MFFVKKSEGTAARREITFTSVDSGAGFPQTRLSGALTFTVKIVKSGGTVITGGGSVTQYDSTNLPGVRTYLGASGDFDTVGTGGVIRISATGMEPREIPFTVIETDLFDVVRAGLTALPNVASGSAGAIPTTGTGANQINVSGGRADADVKYWNGSAVATPGTAGVPSVDAVRWATQAIPTPTVTGVPKTDNTHWLGSAISAPTNAGIPKVDTTHFGGTVAPAPTTAGIPKAEAVVGAATITSIQSGLATSAQVTEIQGLLHKNGRLDNTTYNAKGLMTSARLRVFSSAAACDSATDGAADNADLEIARYTITTVDEGDGTVKSYRLTKQL